MLSVQPYSRYFREFSIRLGTPLHAARCMNVLRWCDSLLCTQNAQSLL